MKYEKVITSMDIQNAYIKFYTYMMQYLWDLNTVMTLAKLEISIYKRFPKKEEMEQYIDDLEKDIYLTFDNEEALNSDDFKKSFEHLKHYIEDYEENGLEIYAMVPNIDVDEILGEDKIEDNNEGEKKTIEVGKVVRR